MSEDLRDIVKHLEQLLELERKISDARAREIYRLQQQLDILQIQIDDLRNSHAMKHNSK